MNGILWVDGIYLALKLDLLHDLLADLLQDFDIDLSSYTLDFLFSDRFLLRS